MKIIKCASQTLQEIQSETYLQLPSIKRRKLLILLTIGHKKVIRRKAVIVLIIMQTKVALTFYLVYG